MSVPITTDLEGYRAFWEFWLTMLCCTIAACSSAVFVMLLLIWRRLGA